MLADWTHVLPRRGAAGQARPQPQATAWQGSEALPQVPGPAQVPGITWKRTCLGCLQRRLPQRSPEKGRERASVLSTTCTTGRAWLDLLDPHILQPFLGLEAQKPPTVLCSKCLKACAQPAPFL